MLKIVSNTTPIISLLKIEPYFDLLVKNGIWTDKELFTRALKLAKEN